MKHFSYTHLPATRKQTAAWRILLTGGAPLLTLLALAGLFWLLGAAPTAAAPAATLYASPDGAGTDCTSPANPCPLQTAVDVANPGDTIHVAAGTYTAAAPDPVLSILKTVHLMGGYDSTFSVRDPNLHPSVLDGGTTVRVVRIDAGEPTLDGFVIQNGSAGQGAGVNVAEGSSPVLSNNRFENNVTDGDFQHGGALYDAGGATLTGNQFVDNHADLGGAVYIASSALSPALYFNEINNNTAQNFGSAFQAISNLFYENETGSFGGALWSAGEVALWNNTLVDNSAGRDGGAIYIDGPFTASNNIIAGNSNPAIDVDSNGSATGSYSRPSSRKADPTQHFISGRS